MIMGSLTIFSEGDLLFSTYRLCQRNIVRSCLPIAFRNFALSYQFAFKPTGSKNASVILVMHHTRILLETNDNVKWFLVDFSKNFATVGRLITIKQLKLLNFPPFIVNGLYTFFQIEQSMLLSMINSQAD